MQIPSRGSLLVATLSILAPLAASTLLSRAPSARAAAQSAALVRPRPNASPAGAALSIVQNPLRVAKQHDPTRQGD